MHSDTSLYPGNRGSSCASSAYGGLAITWDSARRQCGRGSAAWGEGISCFWRAGLQQVMGSDSSARLWTFFIIISFADYLLSGTLCRDW